MDRKDSIKGIGLASLGLTLPISKVIAEYFEFQTEFRRI